MTKSANPHRPIEQQHNPGPNGEGDGIGGSELESGTFTMLNAFWFMIASLLQQGTDILPRLVRNKR